MSGPIEDGPVRAVTSNKQPSDIAAKADGVWTVRAELYPENVVPSLQDPTRMLSLRALRSPKTQATFRGQRCR